MRLSLLLCITALSVQAQQFSFGLRAGIPVTDVYEPASPFTSVRTSTTRFTAGPSFEMSLPQNFSFGFDALFKRFDQQAGSVRRRGSSWEFPLLLKYRIPSGDWSPLVEAGVTVQRLDRLLIPPRPGSAGEHRSRGGVVIGAGLERKFDRMRIQPGIRYSYWRQTGFVAPTNLVDILVGFVF